MQKEQLKYRMDDLGPDFELLDLWAFPFHVEPGSCHNFQTFLAAFEAAGIQDGGSSASSFLFWLRERMGQLLGWDEDANTLPIPGCTESSLRERLSVEEQRAQSWFLSPDEVDRRVPFRVVYTDERECLKELSNATVHAVLQLVWVLQPDNSTCPQLAVYVKHRGQLGRYYMALIKPFRYLIVYPALLKQVQRSWLKLTDTLG